MSVAAPTDMNAAFANAYNDRDVDRLCELYAPDGAVVDIDGTLSIGSRAIREHIAGLLQLGGVMESINTSSHVNGDLALIGARWSIRFDDGRPAISGRSAEVLRRDDDGWRYLIDHPAAD
jgi:ketosteroid isomerase-like protein